MPPRLDGAVPAFYVFTPDWRRAVGAWAWRARSRGAAEVANGALIVRTSWGAASEPVQANQHGCNDSLAELELRGLLLARFGPEK